MLTQRFITGIIGQPFGLKGYVRVQIFSENSAHLKQLKHIIVRLRGDEKDLLIEEVVSTSSMLAIKFKGIDTPEEARLLNGAELLIDREQGTPLKENEYYIEDLKGLAVHLESASGPKVGEIHTIVDGGGGQLAEVLLTSGEYCLIPLRKEFFGEINLQDRIILLKEGWILE